MIEGRTFLSREVPRRDATATAHAVLAVSCDITGHQHAEQALQRVRRLYV
jgi:hypothetical protein